MDKKLVAIVQERAGGYCEVCGGNAEESMALHHRKLRSRGGTDSPANLIWIHHGCHNLNTTSIHLNPADATQKGWMVSSWQDPEKSPFVNSSGVAVLLLNDGSIKTLGKVSNE